MCNTVLTLRAKDVVPLSVSCHCWLRDGGVLSGRIKLVVEYCPELYPTRHLALGEIGLVTICTRCGSDIRNS